MLLKGEMISQINDSYLNTNSTHHRHFPQLRQITSTSFYHRGIRICRKTYLFLHSIGIKRYKNLRANLTINGILPRVHGNIRRVPVHAFRLEETQIVARFITNYTEDNGIHLPGRIPGFKKTDIQLLPCHTTKESCMETVLLGDSRLQSTSKTSQHTGPFSSSGRSYCHKSS